MSLYADLAGTLRSAFKIKKATLDASGLTAARTYALPDKPGSLALSEQSIRSIGAVWYNNGANLVAADADLVCVPIPISGQITKAKILGVDGPGSCVIDVWKAAFADYPPLITNSITASAKPSVVSGIKSEDATLSGWTTLVSAGDVLAFKLESVSTFSKVTITLDFSPT